MNHVCPDDSRNRTMTRTKESPVSPIPINPRRDDVPVPTKPTSGW